MSDEILTKHHFFYSMRIRRGPRFLGLKAGRFLVFILVPPSVDRRVLFCFCLFFIPFAPSPTHLIPPSFFPFTVYLCMHLDLVACTNVR